MAVALTAAAALGAYKIISGGVAEHKANKEADLLRKTRPKASLNPETGANLRLAESELSSGGGAEINQSLREGEDSATADAIGAELKGGGTPSDVASVFSNNAAGRLRMAQYKENLRQQQIGFLSNAETAEANDIDKVFDYNSRGWFDDAQANAAKKQQAANELNSGISDVVGGVTNFATQTNNAKTNQKTLDQQQKMYDQLQNNFMQQMQEYMYGTPAGGVRS